MKKIILGTLFLVLMAPSAFASKARLISLGQDKNGSPYLEDTRSVFLNPALLNKQADFADFELGSSTVGTNPNAEGGFFHSMGGYKLGVELGRETDIAALITTANSYMFPAGLPASFTLPHNTVEVQVASGDSYKWGLSLIYGTNEERAENANPAGAAYPNRLAKSYEIHGGLSHDHWDVHAAVDVFGSAETQTADSAYNKFTLNPSFKLGATYELDAEEKVYVESTFMNYVARNNTQPSDRTGSDMGVSLGYVHFLNPEPSTRFFYATALSFDDYKLTGSGNNNDDKVYLFNLPIVIGLENAATDWLKLRASVTQRVLLDQRITTVTNNHNPNSTTVAAGVGLKWKKIDLDGTLAGGGNGLIDGNNLLANASLTYYF